MPWVKTQTLLQITILTTSFWKLSFCISPCSETPLAKCDQMVLLYSKVVRIGAYKRANYSPKITNLSKSRDFVKQSVSTSVKHI